MRHTVTIYRHFPGQIHININFAAGCGGKFYAELGNLLLTQFYGLLIFMVIMFLNLGMLIVSMSITIVMVRFRFTTNQSKHTHQKNNYHYYRFSILHFKTSLSEILTLSIEPAINRSTSVLAIWKEASASIY